MNVRSFLTLAFLCTLALVAFQPHASRAQVVISPPDTVQIRSYKTSTGLAIPDIPAFKILGDQPSDILRPSSIRDVAVQAGEILANKGALPGSFALESAVLDLVGMGNLSLMQYRTDWKRILGLSRLSIGTTSPVTGGIDVGIGWRATLLDDADPRLETGLDSVLWYTTTEVNRIRSACRIELVNTYGVVNVTDAMVDSCAGPKLSAFRSTAVDTTIESYLEKNWNRPIVDAGVAMLSHSVDSTFKGLFATKYQAWLTYGLYVVRKMQLVIGSSAFIAKDSSGIFHDAAVNLGLRFYYGSNDLKAMIEGDWTAERSLKPVSSVGIGTEFAAIKNIWIDVLLSGRSEVGKPMVFQPTFNVKFGT